VLVSLALSMGIYHFFIRPFAVTRFLFGMKGDKKQPLLQQKLVEKQLAVSLDLNKRAKNQPLTANR
jgi:hypothetical protein